MNLPSKTLHTLISGAIFLGHITEASNEYGVSPDAALILLVIVEYRQKSGQNPTAEVARIQTVYSQELFSEGLDQLYRAGLVATVTDRVRATAKGTELLESMANRIHRELQRRASESWEFANAKRQKRASFSKQ